MLATRPRTKTAGARVNTEPVPQARWQCAPPVPGPDSLLTLLPVPHCPCCSWYESCDMANLYPVPNHPDYKSQVVRGVSDGGWTIVVVLLLCGAMYTGGGILIGKRAGGARGTGAALHPHYASWIALAALVSDGVAFARAGGKPHAAGYRPVGGGAAAAIAEGVPAQQRKAASSAKKGSRSKHSSDSREKHSSSSSSSSSKRKKAGRKSDGSEKEGSSSLEPAARNDRHSPSSGGSPPAGSAAPAANEGGEKSSSSGGGGRWVHVPQ